MLRIEEETLVVDFVANYLAPIHDFRTAAVANLPVELARTIGAAADPQGCARLVVTTCLRNGYSMSPPALVRLLAPHRANADIAAILARLEAARLPDGVNPVHAQVLVNRIPFINRSKLRIHVESFLKAAPPRSILVVSGETKTGKSYTSSYLRHLGAAQQAVCVCDLEYSDDELPSVFPMDVARDLVAAMGRPTTGLRPPDTNNVRWISDLARTVIEEANQAQTADRWWFVLDGLYGKRLRPETREFVNAFALAASRGAGARNFRVVLLGFDRAVLKLPVGSLAVEDLGPVGEAEVSACVNEILRSRRKEVSDPRPYVDDVLRELPAEPKRFEEINRRLCVLIESVDEENAHVGS